MTSRATMRLIALAIAGILVAAAVAVVAGQLASRQIGLASEPVSAGDELAPAVAKPRHERHNEGERGSGGGQTTTTTPTTVEPPANQAEPPASTEPPTSSEPPVTSEPPSPGDDSSAGGGGEGGGSHGDD
jgi:hypothetical protein